MKKSNRVSKLINSLVNLTKNIKCQWNIIPEYLDENNNENLKQYIISANRYYNIFKSKDPYLIENNSFCVEIDSGFIYIFVYDDNRKNEIFYILSAQKTKSSNIIELNTRNTYQEELKTLNYHIKNHIDSIDSFVDSIILKGNAIDAKRNY